MREKITVTYPEIKHRDMPLSVERIDNDVELYELAPGMLDLRADAFSRQLEMQEGMLAEGTVHNEYTPSKKENLQRMRRNIDRVLTSEKGEYYVVRNKDSPAMLDGLLQTRQDYEGDCFVDELIVGPSRARIGSALVHAAFTLIQTQRYPMHRIKFETVRDGEVSELYVRLGAQTMGAGKPWRIGERSLPIEKYVIPGPDAIANLASGLEARVPELMNFKIIYSTEQGNF